MLVFSFTSVNYAQAPAVDRAEVPLTDPSKPALVNARVNHGEITVTGYNGKTIMVEAKVDTDYRESKHLDKVKEKLKEKLKETNKEKSKKTEGMHVIKNNSTGLSIEEENNVVDIKVSSFSKKVDVNIKVPYKSSLKLKGFQAGNIKVENVDGELDVTHHNGPITLNNVSGTVVAHTFNGQLTVSFDRVNLNKPMSFSTFNGDIDVTFPKNAKFSLKMKSDQGEIYSDFKLEMRSTPSPEKKPTRKDGKYVIKFDKTLYGILGGGGEEVQFKTFNGDIYIRAKK
jgi:DUF4097 and DUF4098 domain-containing protein YvlB